MRMKPIVIFLALVAMCVTLYNFSLGLGYFVGYAALAAEEAAGRTPDAAEAARLHSLIPRHFVWGMIAGVCISLVHSVVLTYFLGTGWAIKEQMELRGWGDSEHKRWKKLMGGSVAPTSLGIVLIMVVAFSGGFTMIRMLPPVAHLVIATIGVFGQVPIFLYEIMLISKNGKIMDEIVEKLGGEELKLTL